MLKEHNFIAYLSESKLRHVSIYGYVMNSQFYKNDFFPYAFIVFVYLFKFPFIICFIFKQLLILIKNRFIDFSTKFPI